MAQSADRPNPQDSSVQVGSMPAGMCSFTLETDEPRFGRRRHTVTRSSFVIGSDPSCDLCLDAAGIPPVGWLLRRQPEGLEIESLAEEWFVRNGSAEREALLTSDDLLQFGELEVRVHLHAMRFDLVSEAGPAKPHLMALFEQTAPVTAEASPTALQLQGVPLAECTAGELVEAIEEEAAAVEEFESRRGAGLRALLSAALGFRKTRPADSRGLESKASRGNDAAADTRAGGRGSDVEAEPGSAPQQLRRRAA